jgi:hypothetical protein
VLAGRFRFPSTTIAPLILTGSTTRALVRKFLAGRFVQPIENLGLTSYRDVAGCSPLAKTIILHFATTDFNFYPRLVRGGYFFMHDYNSDESGRAVSRAAHSFMNDKPELLIEIPDFFGTALFRKI